MRSRPRAVLVALGLALPGFAHGRPAQAPPSFPAEARLVTIDVLALDHTGAPVRGLAAADFVVEEDGVPQEIARFEAFDLGVAAPAAAAAPAPSAGPVATSLRTPPPGARSFVLLVDDLALAAPRQTDVRRAIERFADEGLRDGDEVLFLTTSGEIRWSARIPEGREDVRALAARIRGRRLGESVSEWMSDWEAFRIHRMESPTGAALEASGISLVPDGPPDGSIPVTLAAGASATERVVGRWLERGVCTPEAVNQCRARVAGRARLVDHASTRRSSRCPRSAGARRSFSSGRAS